MPNEAIPRMRTAPKIVAELKAMDPESEVTEYFIRQLVKNGLLKVTWAGNKALINLNDVLELLRAGNDRPAAVQPMAEGIRRIDERRAAWR